MQMISPTSLLSHPRGESETRPPGQLKVKLKKHCLAVMNTSVRLTHLITSLQSGTTGKETHKQLSSILF